MLIEVSNGELLDKISILEIKMEMIEDKEKLVNIHKEFNTLNPLAKELFENHDGQLQNHYLELSQLGNPTSVKKIGKYSGRKPRAGEIFTEIIQVASMTPGVNRKQGAPASVRASIKYNDLLRFWELDRSHNLITDADKIKWVYLKDNPYKIEALAFLEYDMPKKIEDFLAKFADRNMIFESILLNKLEGFFSDLQWSFDINPYVNALDSFEI